MTDKTILAGEVWFVNFPLEENPNQFLRRPVVVLNVETLEVLSVKVTKTEPRAEDQFDTPIVYWQQANLRFKSTARVSKTTSIPRSVFRYKIGTLHPDDFKLIQEVFMKFVSQ
jgi:hypothetical protein